MAPRQATQGEPCAPQHTVDLDALRCIPGARRLEPATGAQQPRECQLVDPNQQYQCLPDHWSGASLLSLVALRQLRLPLLAVLSGLGSAAGQGSVGVAPFSLHIGELHRPRRLADDYHQVQVVIPEVASGSKCLPHQTLGAIADHCAANPARYGHAQARAFGAGLAWRACVNQEHEVSRVDPSPLGLNPLEVRALADTRRAGEPTCWSGHAGTATSCRP